MPVDYNRTAHIYQWVERLVFGKRLERARAAFLDDLASDLPDDAHVLLIGDGDGRFLKELLDQMPRLNIDYVEPSATMIAVAKKRVSDPPQVRWINQSIQDWSSCTAAAPITVPYSLVVSHFIFDSLPAAEILWIIQPIRARMAPDSRWIITDFDATSSRFATCLVAVMYGFFRLTAGVPYRKLEKFNTVFDDSSLSLSKQKTWLGGLIYSQMWRKCTSGPTTH